MDSQKKQVITLVICGAVAAAVAIMLAAGGNPKNMAICIACFLRDTTGALGLHKAEPVQYVRPEIIGIIVGALLMSVAGKEYRASAGSSPITRFFLGFIVMIGCLVFLGCPLRMVLRMAGGDLNAWVGLVGFAAGIGTGIFFLNKGFSLGRAEKTSVAEASIFPIVMVVVLILSVATSLFAASNEGPGSMHAAVIVSLIGGLLFGALAQKSRMCFVGGLRDVFLVRDGKGLIVIGMLFAGMLIYNLASGNFKLGFEEQPIAYNDALWNILSMYVVGFGAALAGGCPLRQLVLAGQGSSDSAAAVLGLMVGAAFCHNFGIASSAAGATANGMIMTVVCIVVLFVIASIHTFVKKN